MKSDKVTSIFWLAIGILLSVESYRLNLGGFHRPGSGLFPFLIGIFLSVESSVLLVQSLLNKSEKKEAKEKINLRKFLLCLISLYVYALVFEWLGFMPSTFLLIFFLLRFVEKKGWGMAIIAAFFTAMISHLFFKTLLHATLPRGIFGI